VEILNRVDRPTIVIYEDEVKRIDERESGFNRAVRGDFGEDLKKERTLFGSKHPLSAALVQIQNNLWI